MRRGTWKNARVHIRQLCAHCPPSRAPQSRLNFAILPFLFNLTSSYSIAWMCDSIPCVFCPNVLLQWTVLTKVMRNFSPLLSLPPSETSSSGHHGDAAGLAGSPTPCPLARHSNLHTRVSLCITGAVGHFTENYKTGQWLMCSPEVMMCGYPSRYIWLYLLCCPHVVVKGHCKVLLLVVVDMVKVQQRTN